MAASLYVLLAGCSSASRPFSTVPSASPTRTPATAVVAGAGPAAVIGRSVLGRALVAYTFGKRAAPERVLIIGVVHGDETAGLIIAEELRGRRPALTEVVIVPDLNSDGVALHTRQNAPAST